MVNLIFTRVFLTLLNPFSVIFSHRCIEPGSNYEVEDCNKTIYLTRDKTKATLSSPGFPRFYANNMNCLTFIVAPTGYRVLIEFEELVVEHEPLCTYDFLEMFEPTMKQATKNRTSRHNRGLQKKNMQNAVYEVINSFPSIHKQQQIQQLEFQQLLKDYVHQPLQPKNIFQPSNALFNLFRPPPSTSDRMPRIICGDWSSKLKLLRYQTASNLLGVRFSSDYSHNFSGFKAKISMEKGWLLPATSITRLRLPLALQIISRNTNDSALILFQPANTYERSFSPLRS